MSAIRLVLAVLIGFAALASGLPVARATEENAGAVSQQQLPDTALEQLTTIRSSIELIAQLRRQGVEVDADGAIVRRLLADAASLTGGKVDSQEKLRAATGTAPTPQAKKQGWFTFINVLAILGVLIMVAAVGFLLRHYLAQIPALYWEVFCYVICFSAIAAGSFMSKGYMLAPVLPGCLGLLGCFGFSRSRRSFAMQGWMAWPFAVIWGAAALFYHDNTLGFFAVAAALWALGFHVGLVPGVVSLGFRDRDVIPRATLAAGAMLVAHVGLHCSGLNPPWLVPFRSGMGFLGVSVYLLGLLIMSCRYYVRRGFSGWRRWLRYGLLQVLAMSSGFAAIYFGGVYRVDALLGVGGTFLYLYLFEKYFELPWRGVAWVWAMLGAGCLLYLFTVFAQAHPEWFFFMQ